MLLDLDPVCLAAITQCLGAADFASLLCALPSLGPEYQGDVDERLRREMVGDIFDHLATHWKSFTAGADLPGYRVLNYGGRCVFYQDCIACHMTRWGELRVAVSRFKLPEDEDSEDPMDEDDKYPHLHITAFMPDRGLCGWAIYVAEGDTLRLVRLKTGDTESSDARVRALSKACMSCLRAM